MHTPRVSTLAAFWVALLAVPVLCAGCAPSTDPGNEPTGYSDHTATPSTSSAPGGYPSLRPSPTPGQSSVPDPGDDASVDTVLDVALYPDGNTLGSRYTLECSDGRAIGESQAPDPTAACEAIKENPQILAPQRPADRMCTEIYGGPDRAVVTGTHDGEQVTTEFIRTNGCHIAEWDALDALLGQGGM